MFFTKKDLNTISYNTAVKSNGKQQMLSSFVFSISSLEGPVFKYLLNNVLYNTLYLKTLSSKVDFFFAPQFQTSGLKRSNFSMYHNKDCFLPNPIFIRHKETHFDVSNTQWVQKNDLHFVKSLLCWEQFYFPGFVNLNQMCNWSLFLTSKNEIFLKHRWVLKNFSNVLCSYLISKNIIFQVDFYLPPIMKETLLSFIKDSSNHNDVFFMVTCFYEKFFKWSDLLSQNELVSFYKGGWLESSTSDFYIEIQNWIDVQKSEVDPYKLFYDFEDEIDFESIELYLWPFTQSFDDKFKKLYDLKPSYQGMFRFEDVELFEYLYFFFNDRVNQSKEYEFWRSFFQINVQDTVWSNFSFWIDFFFPRIFNVIQPSEWKSFFFRFLIGKVLGQLNYWFLFGLRGSDRRNVFFRFFFFFVCSLRGWFFKWWCLVIKRFCFNLPWEEELKYVMHLLEQDQLFFVEKSKILLESAILKNVSFLRKKISFSSLFSFFFKNSLQVLVLQKRDYLYPDFLVKLRFFLIKYPRAVIVYAFFVTCHVYCSVFIDFCFKKGLFFSFAYFFDKLCLNITKTQKPYEFLESNTLNVQLIVLNLVKKLQVSFKYTFLWKLYEGASHTKNLWFFVLYEQLCFFLQLLGSYCIFLCRNIFKYIVAFLILSSNHVLNEYLLKQTFRWNLNTLHNSKTPQFLFPRLKQGYRNNLKESQSRFYFLSLLPDLFMDLYHTISFIDCLVFIYEFLSFFFFRFFFSVFYQLYVLFWNGLYKFRVWKWKIRKFLVEKKNIFAVHEWKRHYTAFTTEESHQDYNVYKAFLKTQETVDLQQNSILTLLKHKMQTQPDPFKNKIWTQVLLISFLFVFFRKLYRKGEWFKNQFLFVFNKFSLKHILNNITFFKVGSFFFSFVFFYTLRIVFLVGVTVMFFIVALSLVLFNYLMLLCKKVVLGVGLILFLSLLYPLGFLFYLVVTCFLKIIFFFTNLFWSSITFICWSFVFFLYNVIGKKVLAFLSSAIKFVGDLFILLYFKWIYFYLYVSSAFWWIGKLIIVIFSIFSSIIVSLAKKIIQIHVKKDNQSLSYSYNQLIFFLKEETMVFKNDIKEIFFSFLFGFRFLFFLLSFFFFLCVGLGWTIFFFSYPDGMEISRPEASSKRAYNFLDKWSLLFFNKVKTLNVNVVSVFYWFKYNMFEFVVYVWACFLYFFVFLLYLIKNFLLEFFLICKLFEFSKAFFRRLFLCFIMFRENISLHLGYFFWIARINNSVFNVSLITLCLLRVYTYCCDRVAWFSKVNWSALFKDTSIFFVLCNIWLPFFKKYKSLRDLQELMLFIRLFYNFTMMYWAWVIMLSIEVGDLGWWLNYNKNNIKISRKKFMNFDIIFTSRSKVSSFLKDAQIQRHTTFHSYYLTLHHFLQSVMRYKPYVINSIFYGSSKNFFKNSFFFKKKRIDFNIMKFITTQIGFAFIFEVLLQRFQHPVTKFIFGNLKQDFHLPTSMRLKFFRDFFTEFTWLISYTYTSMKFGVDEFVMRFVAVFMGYIRSQNFYYKKFRKGWFSSILKRSNWLFSSTLPKYRWSYLNFLRQVLIVIGYGFIVLLICLVFFLLFFILAHIFIGVFFFFAVKTVFNWIRNLFLY